jgi:hypothetical protein
MAMHSIQQFKKMLLNLENCMTKAVAYSDSKKFEINVLTNSRLAPDMFPFVKQIQSACDAAKFGAAYLSGQTAPKHEDNETTWNECRERIKKVVTYLETFKDDDFTGAHTIQVKPGWAKGKWLHGHEYLNEVTIPNFYFHVMTAYAILRHAGVDIGKMDYLGHVSMKD